MKYSKLFFAAFSLIFLFSCSKDDESLNADEEKLVGSWKLTEMEYGGETTTDYQSISSTVIYTGEGFDMDLSLEFKNDRQLVTSGDYSIELEMDMEGIKSTDYWTNQDFLGKGSWHMNGNKLIVDTQGQTQEAIVETLDENTLHLSYEKEEVKSQGGATVTIIISGFYVFERM